MAKRNSLSYQIGGIWANGYDKELHGVPALLIAKTTLGLLMILSLVVWVFVAIISPRTARDTIRTWRDSRKADQQAAE